MYLFKKLNFSNLRYKITYQSSHPNINKYSEQTGEEYFVANWKYLSKDQRMHLISKNKNTPNYQILKSLNLEEPHIYTGEIQEFNDYLNTQIKTDINLRINKKIKNHGNIQISRNYKVKNRKVGRSWHTNELRIKSDEDLHKLYYILIKENNALQSQQLASKQHGQTLPKNYLHRVESIRKSIERLKTVVSERQILRDSFQDQYEEEKYSQLDLINKNNKEKFYNTEKKVKKSIIDIGKNLNEHEILQAQVEDQEFMTEKERRKAIGKIQALRAKQAKNELLDEFVKREYINNLRNDLNQNLDNE